MVRWMQTAKEQLAPISAMLEKLQQEREELLVRQRLRQEEAQEKVGCCCSFWFPVDQCVCRL